MTSLFGFADRSVAERLKTIGSGPELAPQPDLEDDSLLWVLRTPAAGIPGVSDPESETLPTAACEAYSLVLDGAVMRRVRLKNPDGDPYLVTVANMAADAIAGGVFIRASRCVGGGFLVDWASC